MKNRKLFAIITLVAFMLTMMPMMAFAASASNSSISVEDANAKVSVKAEGADVKDALEFVVDLDGDLLDTQRLVIFAERNGALSDVDYFGGSVNHVWNDAVNKTPDDCGMFIIDQAKVNAMKGDNQNNEFSFYVASETAGTITLKAYIVTLEEAAHWNNEGTKPTKAELYNGSNDFIRAALVGNGVTGKFNPKSSDINATATVVADREGAGRQDATVNVGKIDNNESTTINEKVKSNNGVEYFDFSLKFEKGGSKLVGEDVTITIDKIGATVNKEEVTTSATGKADFKVSASKPGTYTVTVECGSYNHEFKVTFEGTNMTRAEFASVVTGTIATDVEEPGAMKFEVFDGNGNTIDAVAGNNGNLDEFVATFEVEVISAPEDSTLEEATLGAEVGINDNNQFVLDFEPDMPGTYTIKVYNKNTGVSDVATIKADEFGTIDHATISYPSATYALGGKTPVPTVYVYDQNGVKKRGSAPKYSYSGLGVSNFNEGNGQITFKSGAEYAGKEVVVSVVTNTKYAASTTLTIGAAPASIQFETVSGKAGEEVTVTGQVIDTNGNKAAISSRDDYDVDVQSAIIVERPAGAIVSVDYDDLNADGSAVQRDFLQKGLAPITIVSNTEGTVKVNLVVKLTADDDMIVDGVSYPADDEYYQTANGAYKYDQVQGKYVLIGNEEEVDAANRYGLREANPYVMYLSGVATVGVGVNAGDVDTANDVVTFIINTNTFIANDKVATSDVAPYIVDGRTFIPVRAFVEATGAAVEYDAATQVVTIKGNGIDAQMTIGSNILTVNGETVVMDTAAAIKDGRTVLPVRYAGQAIGYNFECAYGANGAVTAVTMYK